MTKFLIDTISTHRIRYAFEAKSAEEAQEMYYRLSEEGHILEFGQQHLGELICTSWELSDQELEDAFYTEHEYLEGVDVNGYVNRA